MTSAKLKTTGFLSILLNGSTARNNGVTTPEDAPKSPGTRSINERAPNHYGTRELGSETHSYRTDDGNSQPGDVPSTDQDGQGPLEYFEDFSGVTTLHGLRYIGDQTSVIPRRLLWLALLLVCATLFGLQVRDRADYFWSSPVSVNFKVNYNTSLAFPAVTLCNQNSFVLSAAYKNGWLEFIEGLYGDDPALAEGVNKTLGKRPNVSVNKLFRGLAHKLSDFIIRCRWGTEECSAANFTTTLTSHGVCFTFNKVDSPEDSLTVEASGAEHGLRLTLNTEHYERTKGPHGTTGIKMLMTDQSAAPMVEEIGLAISAGTHAFVGIQVMTLNNQPQPHGVCGEVSLVSTDRYSQESCMMECRTWHAYITCGCRHFYMPNLTGKMPVCTVSQFVSCLQGAVDSFNKVRHGVCDCPSPCFYHIYEPSVSYAASSQIKDDIARYIEESYIGYRFEAAKEILNQADVTQNKYFEDLVRDVVWRLDTLTAKIKHEYEFNTGEHADLLAKLEGDVAAAIEAQDAVFDIQMFVVQSDLLRARDEMEEATFRFVCQDYHGFVRDVQNKVTHLVVNNKDNAAVAEVMYLLLHSSFTKQEDSVKRALNNYTQLVNAYMQGDLILNNTYLDYDLADIIAVIPRKLLNESTDTVLERKDFLNILDPIYSIDAVVKYIFENKTINVDEYRIRALCSDYQHACQDFMSKKGRFYSEYLERPEKRMKQRIDTFNALKIRYFAIHKGLFDNIIFLNASIKYALDKTLPEIKTPLTYALDYASGNLPGASKLYVVYELTDFNTLSAIKRAKEFTEEFDVKADEINDAWSTLESILIEVWKHIHEFNDDDSTGYYDLNGVTWSNQTLEERSSDIKYWIRFMTETLEVRFDLVEYDYWSSGIARLLYGLDDYYESLYRDEEFYRRNFLEVDVYFRELRTEQIDQQVAYDEIALLCDIGGSTGLFIGGSMMTVFEFVEFLFICLMCRVCAKKTKTGTTK